MTAVTYNAVDRGSLVAGHTAGLAYSLNLDCLEGTPVRTRKVVEDTQRTLDDTVETMRHSGKATWQITAFAQTTGALLALREFLDSTEAGEGFSFDEFGTVAAPGTPVTVKRVSKTYVETKYAGTSAVSISFDIEQA